MVDGFLLHDRAIYHHADDSVMRMRGRETLSLRMGRGLAPSVFPCADGPSCLVALGGQQKNSFAIRNGKSLLVSQDMGNLDDWESCQRLKHEVKAYLDLLGLAPAAILCDRHPEYGSSRLARTMSLDPLEVQHHKAHVMACALEHAFTGKALALAWDGWGLANKEELWGGEFFQLDCQNEDWFIERLGSIEPIPLVGADRTAREPRRSALALGLLLFGENAEEALTIHKAAACFADRSTARSILEAIKCGPYGRQSTSVGRLFDAVASFLDLRQVCTFEGQAAILLEGCVDRSSRYRPYRVEIDRREGLYQINWRPGILELLADRRGDRSRGEIAASFHHMLVEAVVLMTALTGDCCVLASGGVFQNCYLVECLKHQLQIRNIELLMPRLLPAHDGNLSAGQLMWALHVGKV
jgi:hydrogenase maturation protein HypF